MGTPTKQLRTDLGKQMEQTHARTNNLLVHLDVIRRHPYVKKDEAETIIAQMDTLEKSMHDLKGSLLEEDWEE